MGFNKPANSDVIATLKAAVAKINALPVPPEFVLHTGDISHLSKAEEFDTVDQILQSASTKKYFCSRRARRSRRRRQAISRRYGKNTKGAVGTALTKRACILLDSSTS